MEEDLIFVLDPSYKPHYKFLKELLITPSEDFDYTTLKWQTETKSRIDDICEGKCPWSDISEANIQKINADRVRIIKPKTRIEISPIKTLASLYNRTFICYATIKYDRVENEGGTPIVPKVTKTVLKIKPIFYGKKTREAMEITGNHIFELHHLKFIEDKIIIPRISPNFVGYLFAIITKYFPYLTDSTPSSIWKELLNLTRERIKAFAKVDIDSIYDDAMETIVNKNPAESFNTCKLRGEWYSMIIAMEICNLGPIDKFKYDSKRTSLDAIFFQCIHILEVMESLSVIHADIKPGNITLMDHWNYDVYMNQIFHTLFYKRKAEDKMEYYKFYISPDNPLVKIIDFDHMTKLYTINEKLLELLPYCYTIGAFEYTTNDEFLALLRKSHSLPFRRMGYEFCPASLGTPCYIPPESFYINPLDSWRESISAPLNIIYTFSMDNYTMGLTLLIYILGWDPMNPKSHLPLIGTREEIDLYDFVSTRCNPPLEYFEEFGKIFKPETQSESVFGIKLLDAETTCLNQLGDRPVTDKDIKDLAHYMWIQMEMGGLPWISLFPQLSNSSTQLEIHLQRQRWCCFCPILKLFTDSYFGKYLIYAKRGGWIRKIRCLEERYRLILSALLHTNPVYRLSSSRIFNLLQSLGIWDSIQVEEKELKGHSKTIFMY